MRNAKLHALFTNYESQANQLCDTWSNQIGYQIKMQYPLVMSGDYEECKINPNKRAIMFVGQIPGKWESPAKNVIEGMEHSDKIITENFYGSSPFFQFMSKLVSEINKIEYDDAKFCYYYTNIFRAATDDKAISDNLKNNEAFLNAYLSAINTIPDEIAIVEPDAILFLTGPDYDKYLQKIFSCSFQPIRTIDGVMDGNFLSRVVAPKLPEKTFRIHHPRNLNFHGTSRKNVLMNTLNSLI